MKPPILAGIAAAALIAAGSPVLAQQTNGSAGAQALHQFNKDSDSTLSWKEVKHAAKAHFKKLDPDHDGTLTEQEAAPAGISAADFKQADPDKDGTLSKKEFMRLVHERFKAADPDHDKTLSKEELDSPAGQSFLQLIQAGH